MNRLNRLHAEQQEVCSSIWGQQLRRRGHQTESSSVLQEDRIYPTIGVVAPNRTNASPYNSRADTQALPHEATCIPASLIIGLCFPRCLLVNFNKFLLSIRIIFALQLSLNQIFGRINVKQFCVRYSRPTTCME